MDRLTAEQESVIIDFLKRWGLDSPELVEELLDHYSQMAIEQMENGMEFQNVVDSWKTKKRFRDLKKIQKEFKKSLSKLWKERRRKAVMWTFTDKPVFILAGLFFLMLFLVIAGVDASYLFLIICVKITLIGLAVVALVNFHRRRKKLDGFYRIASMVSINSVWSTQIMMVLINKQLGLDGREIYIAILFALIFAISFAVDIAAIKLFKVYESETKLISEEAMAEIKLPPRI